jgi:catalase
MLQGRLFSYPDTHRHRLGVNYAQIPINQPHSRVANHQRDGFMAVNGNGGNARNYEPSSFDGPAQTNIVGSTFTAEEIAGTTGRFDYERTDVDFVQAGDLYRLMPAEEKTDLVNNIAGHLKNAKKHIQERQLAHFKRADAEYGQRIEEAIIAMSAKA